MSRAKVAGRHNIFWRPATIKTRQQLTKNNIQPKIIKVPTKQYQNIKINFDKTRFDVGQAS